ncbi:mCG145333, partial [Mus musculus]
EGDKEHQYTTSHTRDAPPPTYSADSADSLDLPELIQPAKALPCSLGSHFTTTEESWKVSPRQPSNNMQKDVSECMSMCACPQILLDEVPTVPIIPQRTLRLQIVRTKHLR